LIFPALYNGPINYYARLVKQQAIVLEQYDSYSKQTYRNRCLIMGANGVHALSVPVKKDRGKKNLLRDIRIDYDTSWNKIHWRGLVAAYATSPFFEFMADEIAPFYEKKFEFLVDLNYLLLEYTLKFLGLNTKLTLSDAFTPIKSEQDPRHFLHPKMDLALADPCFLPLEYHQVFSDRLGFRTNLSILDLLFNEGPDALSYLHSCLRI
jgi:WbqC-like protein family